MKIGWRSLALLLAALALDAQAGAPIVRTRIAPTAVTIGQPVTLTIDVLVPTWFGGAIEYPPALAIPDAVAKLSDERAVNLNERIDGESYAGMSKTYVIVPQKAGAFAVPAIALRVPYAVDGKTAPQKFDARLPPGAEDLGYFISTRSYRLTQQVVPALKDLKVGDAVTRTITQRATDLAPMFLPALRFDPIDGLELYPAEPVLAEQGGQRGAPGVATRIDGVTYVLAKPGRYRLPGVTVGWFDPGQAAMRRAEVPELAFEVAASPAPVAVVPGVGSGQPVAPPSRFERLAGRWRQVLAVTLLLLLSSLALWRLVPAAGRRLRERRRRRAASEAVAFRRLRVAAGRGDPAELRCAAVAWVDRVVPAGDGGTLAGFVRGYGDEGLGRQFAALDRMLYRRAGEDGAPWSSRDFVRGMTAARSHWVRSRTGRRPSRHGFDSLNP